MRSSLVDIREELDEAGKEVRSEAIDVSQMLRRLSRGAAPQNYGTDADDDTTEDAHNGDEGSTTENTTTTTTAKKPLSDEDYSKLVARLDELARLEEEEAAEATVAAARQRMSTIRGSSGGDLWTKNSNPEPKGASSGLGGGWAKGFLNQKPRTVKKSKPAPSVATMSAPPTSIPSSEATTPASAQTSFQSPPQQPVASTATTKRVVAFGENEVREIPRIGHRPVSETRPPPRAATPPPQIPSAATETVVQERSRGGSTWPSNRSEPAAATTTSSSAAVPERPTRPLSRFAQERRQQQQRQSQG